MSGRLLKKVLKEQELKQQQFQRQEEEDDELESPDSGTRAVKNPFDLLNDEDDNDNQENGDEIADETSSGNIDKQEPSIIKTEVIAKPPAREKSKKKKNKKGKGTNMSSSTPVDGLDEALENLSLDNNSAKQQQDVTSKPVDVKARDIKIHKQAILQLDPKYLNPENELRRIFGSRVVKSFERSSQASSSRNVRGGRRGSHLTRKTILVTPAEHWPRWDGSLSMEFLETKEGYIYFRYVHSSSYDQVQRDFETAKAIHDLNGIASILLHNPYHLDSLITMADYFKFVGEHQMAADAIAKSLYALECAWHPLFTPMQGNCQLKISHETNKPMFTTLFTHMKNMDRRGCHRSALEVCKLLLSLDSDDPMGALFCIDYFALRAEEYAWLEHFSEEYESCNSLWLFPNFSYSLAICHSYLEKEKASEDVDVPAKASAADLMKQALMLYPSVLKKLVDKVPLKDQAWTRMLTNPFFRSEKTGSPSLDHLINIYVERSYIIWRLPDVQKLLRDAAQKVIEILGNNSSEAKDWACVRKEAFSSENNEYGHLMVSDFSDTVATLPPENLQNFMVDPRLRQAELIGDPVDNLGAAVPAPRDVTNRNALAVLFESMLPWVNYGDRVDGEANVDDHVNGNDHLDN